MTTSDPVQHYRPHPSTGPAIAAALRSMVSLPMTHRPAEVGV